MLSRTQPVALGLRRILVGIMMLTHLYITNWHRVGSAVSPVGFPSTVALSTHFFELWVRKSLHEGKKIFSQEKEEISYGFYLASFSLYHICPIPSINLLVSGN